jgi:hypothetical protein
MSNVHCLTEKRNASKVEKIDEAEQFISTFYDWCMEHNIDTQSIEFKFNAATVLTVIRSLIHARNNNES